MDKVTSIIGKVLKAEFRAPVIGLLALMIFSGLTTVYLVKKYPDKLGLLKGPDILQQEKLAFVAEVGKKIALPADEEPTIALVEDLDKVEGQPFFRNAEPGDKVLIYTNSKKVVLYRPSEKRVVEVGTVNIEGQQEEGEVAGTEEGLRFVLLNGTLESGLTRLVEGQLLAAVPEAEVITRANAKRSDYETSLLIDLLGNKAEQARELASSLGLKTSPLPEGEPKPEGADFLIIAGADKVD